MTAPAPIALARLDLTPEEACTLITLVKLATTVVKGGSPTEHIRLGAHLLMVHADDYKTLFPKIEALREWGLERMPAEAQTPTDGENLDDLTTEDDPE